MKKKFIANHFLVQLLSITGIAAIFVSSISPAFAQVSTPFQDVHEGDRHFVAIQYLKDKGYVSGYAGNKFYPGQDINRAEALALLFKVLKPKESKSKAVMTFADVKPEDWFYTIVEQAFKKAAINGYRDKLFHPERTINKAETLKTALLLENDTLPVEVKTRPYSDVETDVWFAAPSEISRERGLFTESRKNDGELLPDETLTRGQFAEFIYRLIKSNQSSKFGRATFYADSLAGHGTSSGASYNPDNLTAAHPTLAFGAKLLVKNLDNGKEVEVIVNDRGPYATGVHLDLSKTAFSAIASLGTGIINVEYQVVP